MKIILNLFCFYSNVLFANVKWTYPILPFEVLILESPANPKSTTKFLLESKFWHFQSMLRWKIVLRKMWYVLNEIVYWKRTRKPVTEIDLNLPSWILISFNVSIWFTCCFLYHCELSLIVLLELSGSIFKASNRLR